MKIEKFNEAEILREEIIETENILREDVFCYPTSMRTTLTPRVQIPLAINTNGEEKARIGLLPIPMALLDGFIVTIVRFYERKLERLKKEFEEL